LVRELTALYEAFSEGRPSPLPRLALQYADFARWQRQWLQGEVLDEATQLLAQTTERCAGSARTPTDRPRPKIPTIFTVKLRHFTIRKRSPKN